MSEQELVVVLEEVERIALRFAECLFFLGTLWKLCKVHLGFAALTAYLATRGKRIIHQLARFMVYLDRTNDEIHITS